MKSEQMVQRELESHRRQWGFEHDIQEHGSAGLADAARLLLGNTPPSGETYENWVVELWEKHATDKPRRFAIAAAMLYSAIDCACYEAGRIKVTFDETGAASGLDPSAIPQTPPHNQVKDDPTNLAGPQTILPKSDS